MPAVLEKNDKFETKPQYREPNAPARSQQVLHHWVQNAPGTVAPAKMALLLLPPGLETLEPPFGLDPPQQIDVVGEPPHDAPWHIPLASLASGCAVAEPSSLRDDTPALVMTSIMSCRHCFAAHDRRKLQSAEDRLQCEVAEASRILLILAEGVAQDTTELCRVALEKQRSALTGRLHDAVTSDFASVSLESLGREAAKTLTLFNTNVGSGDAPRRAFSCITQPLQNILVLATSLSLNDDDFTLLRRSRGLTPV